MQKKVIVFLILSFISVFLLANFISANICDVRTRTTCNTAPMNNIVMGLSASANAHGQNATGVSPLYDYVLCCDGGGSISCKPDNSNKILGLSSLTNAHAEIPSGSAYTSNICYGSLACIGGSYTCGSGTALNYSISVLSLSSTTNAHIGGINDYSTKICCGGTTSNLFIGENCNLIDATWQVGRITEGIPIKMTVTGTGCFAQGTGASITFKVYKDNGILPDTLVTTIVGSYPSGSWIPQEGSGYYFVATANRSGDQFSSLNGTGYDELTVDNQPNPTPCAAISVCEDYTHSGGTTPSIECSSDYCDVAQGDSRVNPNPPADYTFGCAWDSGASTCNFTDNYGGMANATLFCGNGQTLCYDSTTNLKYCYPGYTCPSGHQVLSNGNGICDAGEGCGSVECLDNNQDSCIAGTRCKKGSSANEGICYSTGAKLNETACRSGYNLCYSTTENMNYCYPEGVCPAGSTPALGSCSSASPNPLATCIGSNCICKSGVCFDSTLGVGRCTYSYINSGDTCEDGFLTYQWTASWSGTGTRPSACADGSATIECPAQIPLPLFTPINAVITIMAIIGIYAIIILVRKSHKGKKKHRRKR